jgi:hypothetical protein
MPVHMWQDLVAADRVRLLTQRFASLWILPDADSDDVLALGTIPWANVWNTNPFIDVASIFLRAGSTRAPIIVKSANDDVTDFSSQKFVRIYVPPQRTESNFKGLNEFQEMQLKHRVSDTVGLLIVVGKIDQNTQDISFIGDVAPQVHMISFSQSVAPSLLLSSVANLCIFESISEFIDTFRPALERSKSNLANLRDTENLELNDDLLESIEQDWTFLSTYKFSDAKVTQEDFDGFLNGDPVWHVYRVGAPYERTVDVRIEDLPGLAPNPKKRTLTDIIVSVVDEIEATVTDPRNTLRQLRLFSEPGSGTTTSLRQAAAAIAMLGYPVLISNPYPKRLSAQTTSQFIIDTQDRWRRSRRGGMRAAHGNIPFILFVDKDLDEEVEHHRLARGLTSLGREVILVRAFERARDEISRAKDVLCLRADVSEGDMLSIGAHLRKFALQHGLAPVPTDDEWRAYHQGLNVITHYSADAPWSVSTEEVPHLFLVGISPFISERIHDVNSLQQYYFQKWDSLDDIALKQLVHTVAAAGAFGISIPYDSLRRIDEINLGSLEKLSRLSHRVLDVFLHWQHEGRDISGWYLRIRHPIIGRFLADAIDPIEGEVPFKPLLPVLRSLTTKDDDVWFARNLVARLGKYFKRRARGFSLETDTPIQKAARAIFSAIPPIVKEGSRTLMHHEARYHMHVLHACLDALLEPSTTTLRKQDVEDILKDEYQSAERMLTSALAITDSLEPEKLILNTYAMLNFNYANAALPGTPAFAKRFSGGVDLQEEAIGYDASDSLARYQFAHEIFQTVPNGPWTLEEKLEFYSRAEVRLQELVKINQEMTIKNMDPIEAEVQIGVLFDMYRSALSSIPNVDRVLDDFKSRNPEAGVALAVRRVLGNVSLQEGFSQSGVAPTLRELRSELEFIPNKSVRSLLLLYRMYLDDGLGRILFEKRLNIIVELKRKSFHEYVPYWHDEAALLCQLDNLQKGAARFADLRSFRHGQRSAQVSQWFWVNERALLKKDQSPSLRQMSFLVKDTASGIAAVHGTSINVRYQPYQFPEYRSGEIFQAYVRFTLSGMQIVPEALAQTDLKAMGML